MRARVEGLIGAASFLGSLAAYLTLLAYTVARVSDAAWLALPEWVLVAVTGGGLGVLFEPLDLLLLRRGYLLLPVLALMVIWKATRRLVLAMLGAALAIQTARVAALACFAIYVMDHTLGLLSFPLAAIPAVVLARWLRWPVTAVLVVIVGLCIGLLLGIIFQHDYPVIVSPLWRFIPTALLALAAGWLVTRWIPAQASNRPSRLAAMWGLSAVGVSALLLLGLMTRWMQPRPPSAHQYLPRSSYDVHLLASGELVWTDTEHIHVIAAPYGAAPTSYQLAGGDYRTPQRIWSSPLGGFYVQMLDEVGWWRSPAPGQRIEPEPAIRLRDAVLADGSPGALVEDPRTGIVLLVSQWRSQYAVFPRETGSASSTGRLSRTFLGAWSSTPLPAAATPRVAYVSSALGDGGLYELDLDTLTFTRRAATLNLYEVIPDPEHGLLWGARPVTGEVIAVDAATFEVRHRIRTGFDSRDLQRDPRTGALFTCSLAGDVFRVDPRTESAERLTWCGRICRNLFLDPDRAVLWAATDDAICRIPLAIPGAEQAPHRRLRSAANVVKSFAFSPSYPPSTAGR